MGCSASKHKHTELHEQRPNAATAPEDRRHTVEPVPAHPVPVEHREQQFDYDALQEPELEQIDNGLWRDTQDVIGMHNSRQVQHV